LIAGDSWGVVAIPVVERYPAAYGFFFLSLATISMVVLNLILAIIVDASQQARKSNDTELVRAKQHVQEAASKKMQQLCEVLDTNNSGTLTLKELQNGMEENDDFCDAMLAMDICEGDLETVFAILDKDKSGEVDYQEFVKEMQQLRSNDSHTMLVFIKQYVKNINDQLLLRSTWTRSNTKKHKLCSASFTGV
jgi:hypothetical protein